MTENQTQPEAEAQAPESAGEETLYAGKYKSVEELENGYKALSSKLGDQASTEASDQAAAVDAAGEAATSIFGNEQMQAWNARLQESGDLTPEDYQEITQKTGFSADMVRTYIKGLETATQEAATADDAEWAPYYEEAGGKDRFDQMVQWAASSLTQEQIAELNAGLESSSPTQRTKAVLALRNTYEQNTSQPPGQRVTGQPGAAGGLQPFRSQKEWLTAQEAARRSGDPAKMADVTARLAISDPNL
jgi:hypothetical protein